MSEPSMAIVLASPAELVKRNEEAIRAIRGTVEQHYTLRVGGRRYLMVAGAQAVATAMGYTTAIEAVRYVPAAEPLPGYGKLRLPCCWPGRWSGAASGACLTPRSRGTADRISRARRWRRRAPPGEL